jgi:CBS domain-containing protein
MEELRTGYKVCDAMTRKPVAVSQETSVKDAARLMQEKDVGSLVVKEGDLLKGYITEQDVIHKVVASALDPITIKVRDVMNTKVATIEPGKDIFDALVKMRDLDVRQLPVIDPENNDKLVGLLTLKDVLKIQPQLFELIVEKISLREEEHKPIFIAKQIEGTCDICGGYFKKLYELEGEFLCNKCLGKQANIPKVL